MTTEKDWLEEKRTCIGASEWAPVLGLDPFSGPLHVYASKVLGYANETTPAMEQGKIMERPIAEMYQRRTGRVVVKNAQLDRTIQRHPDLSWLGATLDGMTVSSDAYPAPNDYPEPAPLEIKNTRGFVYADGRWKYIKPEDWAKRPPRYNRIQVQAQMSCTTAKWGSLCALINGTDLVWSDQERNNRFILAAIPVLERFWQRVLDKRPPSVNDLPRSLEVVKRMYPDETGEVVTFSDEANADALRWLELRSECSAMEKEKKALEAKLRFAMADNTFAKLSNGTYLSLKKSYRKGYTKVVEPSEYRTLRPCKKI